MAKLWRFFIENQPAHAPHALHAPHAPHALHAPTHRMGRVRGAGSARSGCRLRVVQNEVLYITAIGVELGSN